MNYLAAYSPALRAQAQVLVDENRLGPLLRQKYSAQHEVRTDRALYDYVMDLKNTFLRSSAPLSKVAYDGKLHVIHQALGTHTTVSRVQGSKLKAKREIRIATLFRETPLPFLRMIAVHELAHIREPAHDKAFYQLCLRMEPQYHQFELDFRLYLTHRDVHGTLHWGYADDGTTAASQAGLRPGAAPGAPPDQ